MDLRIPYKLTKVIANFPDYIASKKGQVISYKSAVDAPLRYLLAGYNSWNREDKTLSNDLSAYKLGRVLTDHLLKLAKEDPTYPGCNFLIQQLNAWHSIEKNPTGGSPATVKGMKAMLEAYVNQSKNRFLFAQDQSGNMLPYLVHDIEYIKAHQEDGEKIYASIILVLKHIEIGRVLTDKIYWYNDELRGIHSDTYVPENDDNEESEENDNEESEDEGKKRRKKLNASGVTIKDLLAMKGFHLETEGLLQKYNEMIKDFSEKVKDIGGQYYAIGVAKMFDAGKTNERTWWGSSSYYGGESGCIPMVYENEESLVIVDDANAEAKNADDVIEYRTRYWSGWDEKVESRSNFEALPIPDHPYIIAFHKEKHHHIKIHALNLTKYRYNPELKSKLILPKIDSDMLDLLISSENELMEDIIKGKTGGIIIFATGTPGTGKTLTAEVYSEVVKKPLYIVPSSQLGIDIKDLESNLKKILDRAARWKAILLIDECDVFVRDRGDDIVQNAIVGTFLRILEYYKGVLFMTSNRGEQIDDAIMSRGTAHIKYINPTIEGAEKIWQIQIDQNGLKVDKKEMDILLKKCDIGNGVSKISGRDIKNIVKLSAITLRKQKINKLTADVAISCARFKDIIL